jgi:hypothetical protein
MIAEVPVAKPSNPSVKLAPFETAVTMKMVTRMKKIQPKSEQSPHHPRKKISA